MNKKLSPGDTFPEMTLSVVHADGAQRKNDNEVTLPGPVDEDGYQIILFYRGSF